MGRVTIAVTLTERVHEGQRTEIKQFQSDDMSTFAAFSSKVAVQTNREYVCLRYRGQPLRPDCKLYHYAPASARTVRFSAALGPPNLGTAQGNLVGDWQI